MVKRVLPPPRPLVEVAPANPKWSKMPPKGMYAELARQKLGRVIVTQTEREYMSLGDERLNSVFGVPLRGFFGGLCIEISGESSHGKSVLGAELAGICARDHGAIVHWLDVEQSWSNAWMKSRGLWREYTNVYQPFLGLWEYSDQKNPSENLNKTQIKQLIKDKEAGKSLDAILRARIESAEEMFSDLEMGVHLAAAENPGVPQVVVVDSVAALSTEEELLTDHEDSNMRTQMALAVFLNKALKQWLGKFPQYRATIILLNQLRTKPGQAFGDPTYSPGGAAMRFLPHVRVRLHRKSGFLEVRGQKVGIHGKLKCIKHKADGDEGREMGYKIPWNGAAEFFEV